MRQECGSKGHNATSSFFSFKGYMVTFTQSLLPWCYHSTSDFRRSMIPVVGTDCIPCTIHFNLNSTFIAAIAINKPDVWKY